MPILPVLGQFSLALLFLVISANMLVSASRKLAIAFKLSPLFISLVLVALGTSLPELSVTLFSLQENEVGLAIGNIVGSNTTNATLVFGMAAALGSLKVGRFKTQRNVAIMGAISFLYIFLQVSKSSGFTQAGLLFTALVAVLLYSYFLAWQGRLREDRKFLEQLRRKNEQPSAWRWTLILLASVGGLMFSGNMTVDSIQQISGILGISTSVLGATLTATSTSLPEIVTLIIAAVQKDSKIALGAIIGSNIYNIALLGGIVAFAPQQYLSESTNVNLMPLAVSTLFLMTVVFMKKGQTIPRVIGLIGIGLYAIFTAVFFL